MISFHLLPLWASVVRWIAVVLILGEAFAHLLKMIYFQKTINPWFHAQNQLLLVSDLIFGVILFWAILTKTTTILFPLLAWISLIVTHGYRAAEPFFENPYPFTANKGLGVINFIKLAFLLLIVIPTG